MKKIAWLAFILILSGCTKKNNNSGGRITKVNPFSQYLANNTVNITLHSNIYPLEIGYTFTASDTGTIYEIGLRLPDSSESFMMTVWDAVTQAILIQKPVLCTTNTGFSYDDLSSTNEAFEIQANHEYVISVNLNSLNMAGAGPANYYDARRSDDKDIFPLTESYITYEHQYNKTTYTPAFPDNLIIYQDVINGLVDIGFSHISK